MSEPRRSLSDRLEALRQATTSLGETATATIAAGANALFDNDLAAINAVIESDSVIDDLRHDVDNQCLEILATHSPVASDLRLVLATLRIADSIERTGDLVTESCEIGKTLYPTPIEQRFRRLLELMSRTAEANTRAAVESYTNSDLAEAAVVFDLDSQLDRLASSLARECAIAEPDTEPGVVAAVALIGHCYERIGDNAVTIGERVQFALTGKHPQRRTRYAGQASSS